MSQVTHAADPTALWRYLDTAFTIPRHGGIASAIDYDGARVITADRLLETDALVLWAMAEGGLADVPGGRAEPSELLDAFADDRHGGYLEFLEVSGVPHELAGVKTAFRQFLAALALLTAAERGTADTAERGTAQFRWAQDSFVRRNRLVSAVSRDGALVMDDRSMTAAAAVRALAAIRLARLTGAPADRATAETLVRELLAERVASDGAVVGWRGLDGEPTPTAKVDLAGQCLTAIALADGARLLDDDRAAEQALRLLEYVDDHMWDGKFTGYWDHCDPDGGITVHREFITLLNSAIPIKTAAGNAWVLVAAARALTTASGAAAARLTAIATRARDYLETMVDRVHGGMFIGEGYFWAPPGTPTGPFVRQVLPPRDTPGVFHFGSTHYLRLYNKQAGSQVLASLALSLAPDTPTRPAADRPAVTLAPAVTPPAVEPVERASANDLTGWMDTASHLRYIHDSFTPGQGYGWTPRVAPLGSGANHAPSAFGTHHSVANLRVLGQDPEQPGQVADWIRYTQTSSGAFADYPGGPADVLNTYLAVNALQLIGQGGPSRPEDTVRFLRACQNDDGGFGVVPGFISDLFHTNLAVVALHALGAEPRDPDSCVRYILASGNDDGGFGERLGTPSDTYSVYRAVGTLALLGRQVPDPKASARFVRDCQGPGGGFRNDQTSRESLIATYHAVAVLALLGQGPERPEECRRWLAGCQTPDGGFSIVPGVSSGTIDEGFAGVQSLAILAGGLSDYFIIAVS